MCGESEGVKCIMTEGLPTIEEEGNWGSKAIRDH